MKRVRVAPGRFVSVSVALAQKAAKIVASDAFRSQHVRDLGASERLHIAGGMLLGADVGGQGRSQARGVRGRVTVGPFVGVGMAKRKGA